MTEELILKPFERVSVSKLDTFEMCPRHYHFQFAYELEEVVTPKQQQNRTLGEKVDQEIEDWLKAPVGTTQLSGAASAVSRHYPIPGQSCVDVQRWVRGDWAGAPWVGKLDLLTGPSTVWGPLNRPQKHGLIRVTDLKSTSDLKWAKTAEQIDRNRQLHMYASGIYRERQKTIPHLFEVSQVVVERGAPYRAQSIARVSSDKQLLELEEEDRPLVQTLIASHSEEDTLALEPASDRGVCERWYGYRCSFADRCWGAKSVGVPQSLGALMDVDAGKGSAGAGRTIDSIAAGSVPVVQQKKETQQQTKETEVMLTTPDAAKSQNAKIEGEDARYRPRTIVQGKSYVAVQGDRQGRTWEFRMLGDNWIVRVADKPGPVEATSGFYPVDTTDESAKGSVPAGTGAKMDIVQLRALFGPFLEAWDARVAPVERALDSGATIEEEDIFGSAVKQIEEQAGQKAPDESRVKELTSVGLTDAQARSLADGGVTLEALRMGSVTVSDLTRCKGIGKGGAEKILSRFTGVRAKPELAKEDAPIMSKEDAAEVQRIVDVVESAQEKPEPVAVPGDMSDYVVSLEDRIAELEGHLLATRLRIGDLESAKELTPEQARAIKERASALVAAGRPEGFTIYVGCRPSNEDVFEFHAILRPYLERVAKAKRVADVSMIDPGYIVPGLVNEALHADPPAPCAFVVSERDQVWGWVRRYFLGRAAEVVTASVVP